MEFGLTKELSDRYLFGNYARADIAFERGEGCYLYDTSGNKYLDSSQGIAVNSIGYAHPYWVKAVSEQLEKMVHVSNLYYVCEQAELGQRLDSITPKPISRFLFVNSGAEANEGALKTAVKYTGRSKVLSALNGFHGRTSASLGATGQAKYQDPFRPLISDAYSYYEYNNLESLKKLISKDTAAVMIETIQGEGGVVPATEEFVKGVRDICSDYGALMIVDEVQTGVGRTGKWWSIEHFGVTPDIITTAKGLAAGVPIGAIMTTDEIAQVMTPGTHGTTFGGNPLACTSACVTLDIIQREGLLDAVCRNGEMWLSKLREIKSDKIVDVRGRGYLLGVEIDTPENAASVKAKMLSEGILVNVCHGKVVRIMPPLIFTSEQIETWIDGFKRQIGQ